MENIRGVNLGGWLVLERWISPNVFRGTNARDEYSLMTTLGPSEAARRIEQHRDHFITEEHIERLHGLGITTLRLPVGYWLFADIDGFIGGADRCVDALFEWAAKRNIAVVICFHAAPGSQNGWDHSGRAGAIAWTKDDNIKASYDFLELLARRYGQNKTLIGIELLNEPYWSLPLNTLLEFYQKAGSMIERTCHSEMSVIVSDGFRPDQMAKLISKLGLSRVILDCHLYQLFTEEDRALDLSAHIYKTNQWAKDLRRYSRREPVIVGEWSAAMSELYNPITNEKQHHYGPGDYMAYAAAQQKAFQLGGAGWFYWTARTEHGGVWSLLDQPQLLS